MKFPLLLTCSFFAISISIAQNFGPDSGRNLFYSSIGNTRINIADNNNFDHPDNNITIEAWIMPTLLSNGCIFSKHATINTREYDLFILSNGSIRLGLINNSDIQFFITSNALIPLNQWVHIAATYSNTSGNACIYINGILDITQNIGNIIIASTSTNPLIGAYWMPDRVALRDHFNGSIDELRLWHNERTLAQIRNNMCRTLVTPQANLIAYYRFDETTGNIANDASGNGNNGTLQNFPAAQINTRNFSGAPIGNASTHQYPNSWTGINLLLNSSPPGQNEGSLTLSNISGLTNPDGIHLFRVDALPSQIGGLVSPAPTYFGTFVAGGSDISYQAQYNYTGSIYDNLACETFYRLSERNDNSNSTWSLLNAPLNTTLNTLTATGLNSRREIILQPSCTALPLEFISFDIRNELEYLDLNWTTTNEINTKNFIIERSYNSLEFTSVGSVEAKNIATTINSYSFQDTNPLTGISYYRLKQTDIDGRNSYSPIKNINRNINELGNIYPNPSNGFFTIDFKDFDLLSIKDCNGKEVYNCSSTGDNNSIKHIDLSNSNAGIYFVYFTSETKQLIQKLIVQ